MFLDVQPTGFLFVIGCLFDRFLLKEIVEKKGERDTGKDKNWEK